MFKDHQDHVLCIAIKIMYSKQIKLLKIYLLRKKYSCFLCYKAERFIINAFYHI